jgi:hypothetical protein
MHHDDAVPHAGPPSEYLWLRDGSLPYPREDRVAEAIALAALLFSLAVGLVIATLPVSDKAAAAAEASLEPSASHAVPARAAPGTHLDRS